MADRRVRNIGQEILEGIREIKRGKVGRVSTYLPSGANETVVSEARELPVSIDKRSGGHDDLKAPEGRESEKT